MASSSTEFVGYPPTLPDPHLQPLPLLPLPVAQTAGAPQSRASSASAAAADSIPSSTPHAAAKLGAGGSGSPDEGAARTPSNPPSGRSAGQNAADTKRLAALAKLRSPHRRVFDLDALRSAVSEGTELAHQVEALRLAGDVPSRMLRWRYLPEPSAPRGAVGAGGSVGSGGPISFSVECAQKRWARDAAKAAEKRGK